MGAFDDELRASLRDSTARVTPPADLLPGIERRARRIRRRRLAGRGTAAMTVAVALAVGTPHLVPDRPVEDKRSRIAATVPRVEGSALVPLSPSPAPRISSAADNQLSWPTRGYRPPAGFREEVDRWYAGTVGREARRHILWSGPLPDGRWGLLEQYWSKSSKTGMWMTVLFVGRRDGGDVDAAYHKLTGFTHQRPRESASMTGRRMDRIQGYAFGFRDFVLVVGSPRAARAAITLDGRTVRRERLVAGAAVFEPVRRGTVELFQLRDHGGTLLTPNDDRAADHRGAVIQGWGFDRP